MKSDLEHHETLPLYRHKELYECNELFQEHKFFTTRDYELEEKLFHVKYKGTNDWNNAHGLQAEINCFWPVLYKDRYGSLKQDTVFFKNWRLLDCLRMECSSYSELHMKLALRGIDEKFLRFYFLYTFFARDRFFERCNACNEDLAMGIPWRDFKKMLKEAFSNGFHRCCSAKEFMTTTLI